MATEEFSVEEAIEKVAEPLHRSRWVWVGGILAFGLAFFGYISVGQIYGGRHAIRLLEAVSPSVQTLCFAGITAASTILALMLTMLAVAHQSKIHFEERFFQRIRQLSLMCTLALSLATMLLAFNSIPVNESETLPEKWFALMYYGIVVATSLLSGILISVVLLLFETIQVMIRIIAPSS